MTPDDRQDLPSVRISGTPFFRRMVPFATAGLLTLAAIIAGWDGVALWTEHSDGVDDWALETHHAAFEIADTLAATVHAIEAEMSIHAVPAAEAMLARRSDPDAMLASFGDSIGRLKQITFFALFSPAGDLLACTDAGLKRQHVTARDRDFLAYFANGSQGSHVTASYLSGPAIERTPVMRILVSRGLRGPDGAFGGVLVAAMAPDYLLHSLIDPSLYLGKDARLFLDNGKLIAVHQAGGTLIGENFAAQPLFRESAAGSLPQWGVLPAPFGDTPEIAALYKADDLPFLVSVMTTNGPDLHGWWHRVAFLLGYAGVSLIGMIIFLLKGLWIHGSVATNAAHPKSTD